jgi:acyl-CoA synthetase (AMP-forming)/AMP-acid ligase II/NAD(P)-dependent dehydrogenase (short-subunit alcohol dehydrogenase family)
MSERLPRPIRLLLGATSRGVSDDSLKDAVAGNVVLVTGASSGVGKATAKKLGAAGADVLLVARRAELLGELRDEITSAGGSAFVHPCNLADTHEVGELAESVLEQHGHVDVVVSNAGISIRRWISQTYERFDDIERTIKLNYLGPVRLLLGLLPSMRERGSGHIVNVSTIGVNFPPLRWSAYIASKSAFESWLAGVTPEVRADGVTTTSIHLQLVRSPMLGPFRIWNYLPGMSTEEAAAIVARAIAERPRTIAPPWARAGAAFTTLAQEPVEALLARYVRSVNPDQREREQTALTNAAGALAGAASASARVAEKAAGTVSTIANSGVVRPVRPDRLGRVLSAQLRFGATPAFAAATGAELYAGRPAVIDEQGTLTFRELDVGARAMAASLHREFDLGSDHRVAVMCRNHRGFVQAAVASTRLGCDLVPLNNDFAGSQLADVLARENVTAAVYDEEFESVFDEAGFDGVRIMAWHEREPQRATLKRLSAGRPGDAPAPEAPGRMVMLTSGTTGTPKGAIREFRLRALAPVALAGLLDLARIDPVPRSGEPIVVGPPLFHLYGLIGMMAAFGLGSPIAIRRRFDPEATLEQIERNRAGVLLAVPTMLGRTMDLAEDTRRDYDTSSLRMIISGAAPLSPELAHAVMDEFGDILYNGYASTEVGSGTLATPADLRAAPGTVGRPAAGATVKILDERGNELPHGETGRIFIGSPLLFEGYTGGGGKEVIDGLMSTGDLGHFDDLGRLFVDGRDDDMIVSGGENVFPQEVEELLSAHEAVADAAVFGVPDKDFGQRLTSQVVLKEESSVSADELKSYVKDRLARHKVPREIEFVEDLPRTQTGKLQRRKLTEQAASRHEQD